jgi:uroporphyrin-III C-methyltransferase/precorrin-2 dehydrogenase/sirohydrochlorin ferrochelatase
MLAAGAGGDRPASAVFNATRPDQRVVAGTVATIAELVAAEGIAGPCLVLIGEILRAPAQAEQLAQAALG